MVIGVTGNTGSGKTTFCRELAEYGGCLINVDTLAHTLLGERPDIVERLVDTFGGEIVKDGVLDRAALAEKAFADRNSLSKLTGIVWPPMLTRLDETIETMKKRSDCPYLVVDMAVLFECGAEDRFDTVITVIASDERRFQRLHRERGWTREEFQRRNRLQLPQQRKASRSQLIIENDGTCEELSEKSLTCYRNLFGLHF